MIAEGQAALNKELAKRLAAGEKEYGKLTWLQADTLGEVMEEVADIINWGSFTWIKLFMLKRTMDKITAKQAEAKTAEGFISMSDLYGHKP